MIECPNQDKKMYNDSTTWVGLKIGGTGGNWNLWLNIGAWCGGVITVST